MNEDIQDHLEYILEKERKTIKKFGIDNLGHSKGNFSDFDDEKPLHITPTINKSGLDNPTKKIIKSIAKDPNKPAKRSDKWFPNTRIQD